MPKKKIDGRKDFRRKEEEGWMKRKIDKYEKEKRKIGGKSRQPEPSLSVQNTFNSRLIISPFL